MGKSSRTGIEVEKDLPLAKIQGVRLTAIISPRIDKTTLPVAATRSALQAKSFNHVNKNRFRTERIIVFTRLIQFVLVKREESAKFIEQNITTTAFSNYLKIDKIRDMPLVHSFIEF
jgi:hypothetical protein